MQAKPTSKIVWSRIPSASGDYCDGYQAKDIDGLRIMRHHVDDRAYDGGEVATYWNLHVDDQPVAQFNTLASAKSEADRIDGQRRMLASAKTTAEVAAEIHAEANPPIHGPYELLPSTVGDGFVIRRKDDDERKRTVSFVSQINEWQRFVAALEDGHDEVAAVAAIDDANWKERIARAGWNMAVPGAVVVSFDGVTAQAVSRIYRRTRTAHGPGSALAKAWRMATTRQNESPEVSFYVVSRDTTGEYHLWSGLHMALWSGRFEG